MQLFALDGSRWIFAQEAQKRKSYLCPECSRAVRLRQGPYRQPHFYHLTRPLHCRQHQKSATHLYLQELLASQLPQGEAFLERRFPSISRIADVFWEKEGIVFEIQCSPLSLEEARQRTEDYERAGVFPVWILHDRRFNKRRLSAAESYLRSKHCFFTNISLAGTGEVYDQFEILQKNRRIHSSLRTAVSLQSPHFAQRSLLFQGSLPDLLQQKPSLLSFIEEKKERYLHKNKKAFSLSFLKEAYLSFLHLTLEIFSL